MGMGFLCAWRGALGLAAKRVGMKNESRAARVTAVALLGILLACGASTAWGQAQNTGSIFGSVSDPSGAVIAGATVAATDVEKGVTRTVNSNAKGDYNLANLPVGTYNLTVTAPGFETFVASSILVDANKDSKIQAKLTVGNKGEVVNVDANGSTVDLESSTLETRIDNKLVESLPIDGNNVVALAGLLPGVTDLNAPATNTSDRGGPTYSVSGSRNTQNLMLFDGLMWNNLFFNTGINFPPPHALQEISVQLNNFKAQYGRNAGSVFNVTTKSGSNQFHIIAWDYFQNAYFNAADYLTHINPKDNSNQFGATITGPIVKDKAYYAITGQTLLQKLQVIGTGQTFGEAERGFAPGTHPALGTMLPNGPNYTRPCTSTGPFAGMTCASFLQEVLTAQPSGNTDNGPVYGKLTNPEDIVATGSSGAGSMDTENQLNSAYVQSGGVGQSPCIPLLAKANAYAAQYPYLNGKVQSTYMPFAEFPTACLNPVIQRVLDYYDPYPNTTLASSTAYGGLVPAALTKAPQPRQDINFLARVDWVVNTRHTIDARYNLINAQDSTASGVTSASVGIANYQLNANQAVSNFGNIGDTWVVTPNIVNLLRLGYKRYVNTDPPLGGGLTLNNFGGNFVEPGVPVMPVFNASNFQTLGNTAQANANVVNENIELLEQLVWTKGAHTYQFGVNFLRLQYLNRTDYPGTFAFSTGFTGASAADESLGLLNSIQANSPLVQGGINHSIFGYAQDDWRATPKLTLNLGLRYELPFQWYQPNGYSSTFIPGHQSTRFPNAIAGLAYPGDSGGVLNSLVPTDFNGIAPRVGFAYDLFGNGTLALRGGFGLFFDAINANVIGVGQPFYYQVNQLFPPGGASTPLTGLGTNGSNIVIPSGYNPQNPQFFSPATLFYPDRNFRTPYYEAFNGGFQYRIVKGGVMEVNYVGKLGRKLTIPFDQNPTIFDCSGGYYASDMNRYCFNAASTRQSRAARARYSPFATGGNGLVDFASIGTSNYNGLQAQYTQRGGKFLTLLMSYTYSKSIDLQTQSQTTTNAIPDVYDVSTERGVSDYNATHIFNMGWLLTPPRVTEGSSFTRAVLNNWRYGGKFLTHSGRPYSVTINNDTALDGEPGQRAAILPGRNPLLPSNRHRTAKVAEYFNVNAFTYPAYGTFSNQQRNSFVGPGYIQTDMNISRQFAMGNIHEGMRMEFRADAYNVFNTPNLANPRASFSCSTTSITYDPRLNLTNPVTPQNANAGLGCADPSVAGTFSQTFGSIASTFGNNANTSTNGRKMQFVLTVFY